MATRLKRRLTDTQVKKVKAAQDKQVLLQDGDGLYLEVNPSGSKIWRMKTMMQGKSMRLTFGEYPGLTLAQARKKCEETRSLINQGIDPREARKAAEAAEKARADNTFEKIARNWHKDGLPDWKENTAKATLSRLERDVFPKIGHMPITDITHQQLIDVLKTIEKRGTIDAAKRTKTDLARIYRYAIQRNIIDRNLVDDLAGVLRRANKSHFATIKPEELPAFLKALDQNAIRMYLSTRIAIQLMLMLFLRTSELIGAEWSEIDLENGVWIVPWQRMKMGKRKINPDKTDHRIDLPRQAIALLKEQYQYSGNRQHVFPGMREPRKPMSNGAILMALRRLGYQNRMTGHGFRALAASALGELGFRREVIERALAHKEKDQVQAAYHRADFQQERKEMLQAWADYIDTIRRKNSIRLVA